MGQAGLRRLDGFWVKPEPADVVCINKKPEWCTQKVLLAADEGEFFLTKKNISIGSLADENNCFGVWKL